MTPSTAASCSPGAATARRILLRLPRRPAAASRSAAAAAADLSTRTAASARSISTIYACTSPYYRYPSSGRHHNPRQHQPQCRPQPLHHRVSNGRNHHYHSHTHPPPPPPFTPAEQTLLRAAYARVPAHGFTPESLALGARDAGLLDISASLLPGGPGDAVFALIRWHLYVQRTALAGKAKELFSREEGLGEVGVGERVEALAWARLLGNVEALPLGHSTSGLGEQQQNDVGGVNGEQQRQGQEQEQEHERGVLRWWQEVCHPKPKPNQKLRHGTMLTTQNPS